VHFIPNPELFMPYFRFDMDLDRGEDYYHNSNHINFGYNCDNVRFSLNRLPYPVEFVKFCLFLMGNSEFKNFNRSNFFTDLNRVGEAYSHLFDFSVV